MNHPLQQIFGLIFYRQLKNDASSISFTDLKPYSKKCQMDIDNYACTFSNFKLSIGVSRGISKHEWFCNNLCYTDVLLSHPSS